MFEISPLPTNHQYPHDGAFCPPFLNWRKLFDQTTVPTFPRVDVVGVGVGGADHVMKSNPWCWDGVECGVGEIQALILSANQLQGSLPGAALGDMHGLVTLDLSDNEIGGRPDGYRAPRPPGPRSVSVMSFLIASVCCCRYRS